MIILSMTRAMAMITGPMVRGPIQRLAAPRAPLMPRVASKRPAISRAP